MTVVIRDDLREIIDRFADSPGSDVAKVPWHLHETTVRILDIHGYSASPCYENGAPVTYVGRPRRTLVKAHEVLKLF